MVLIVDGSTRLQIFGGWSCLGFDSSHFYMIYIYIIWFLFSKAVLIGRDNSRLLSWVSFIIWLYYSPLGFYCSFYLDITPFIAMFSFIAFYVFAFKLVFWFIIKASYLLANDLLLVNTSKLSLDTRTLPSNSLLYCLDKRVKLFRRDIFL